jgi:hypothetical protein
MFFMALSTGGAEFRLTKRGCQLRQPHNLCVIPGQMMSNTNTVADLDVKIQGLSNGPFQVCVNAMVMLIMMNGHGARINMGF